MQPLQQTRPASLARLCVAVDRAFERREMIQLGDHEYTFRKKGETLHSGDTQYEALQDGVYQKVGVFEGGSQVPTRHTFWRVGGRDAVEAIVGLACTELTYAELEAMTVGLAARAVLTSLNPVRENARHDEAECTL